MRLEQPYFIMDLFPGYHLKLPIARPAVYPMPLAQLHRIISKRPRAGLHARQALGPPRH